MTDFRLIWLNGRRFEPADAVREHGADCGFEEDELTLAANEREKAVVVHPPTERTDQGSVRHRNAG